MIVVYNDVSIITCAGVLRVLKDKGSYLCNKGAVGKANPSVIYSFSSTINWGCK